MKPLAPCLCLALFATPALAHPGAHLNPHSAEGWLIGLGVLLTAAAAALALKARK